MISISDIHVISFVAPRYFYLQRHALLLKLHDAFKFARTPFAQILLTSRISRRAAVHLKTRGQDYQTEKSASWQRALARSVACGGWTASKD